MKSTTIQKWGNSMAVRLPSEILKNLNLTEGSHVSIATDKNSISIKVVPADNAKLSLEDLLSDISDENKHTETDFGKPIGKEIW